MDALDNIFSRVSVRQYSGEAISDAQLRTILQAGMSGPSCINARDWLFLVVRDRDKLREMADCNGKPAAPLHTAALAILICGDLSRAHSRCPDYWVIDCAIAGQNMVLAANAQGIGSVWLGTWPNADRVKAQAQLFQLPPNLVPHSIIAFGLPEKAHTQCRDLYDASRVCFERLGDASGQ